MFFFVFFIYPGWEGANLCIPPLSQEAGLPLSQEAVPVRKPFLLGQILCFRSPNPFICPRLGIPHTLLLRVCLPFGQSHATFIRPAGPGKGGTQELPGYLKPFPVV